MSNLPFISDNDLEAGIKHVTGALASLQKQKTSVIEAIDHNDFFKSSLFSNSIDPFAMKFGMALYGEDKWLEMEIIRQLYKTFEQRIGEFHQIILGSVDGWVNLGTGDDSRVDLKREDNSLYIELKNKHNTCNSSSLSDVEKKLTQILNDNTQAKAYWAFIIPGSKKKSGTSLWMSGRGRQAKMKHERLYKIWGADVYELVTGDGRNLQKLYEYLSSKNMNINSSSESLINVADEIINAAKPHMASIKSQIFEEMLVGIN